VGHRRAAREVRQARADAKAADLAPIVRELQSGGVMSLKGVAKAFNERGVLTPAGSGHGHATQVARLLRRWRGERE
jgi:hypothetical protein